MRVDHVERADEVLDREDLVHHGTAKVVHFFDEVLPERKRTRVVVDPVEALGTMAGRARSG